MPLIPNLLDAYLRDLEAQRGPALPGALDGFLPRARPAWQALAVVHLVQALEGRREASREERTSIEQGLLARIGQAHADLARVGALHEKLASARLKEKRPAREEELEHLLASRPGERLKTAEEELRAFQDGEPERQGLLEVWDREIAAALAFLRHLSEGLDPAARESLSEFLGAYPANMDLSATPPQPDAALRAEINAKLGAALQQRMAMIEAQQLAETRHRAQAAEAAAMRERGPGGARRSVFPGRSLAWALVAALAFSTVWLWRLYSQARAVPWVPVRLSIEGLYLLVRSDDPAAFGAQNLSAKMEDLMLERVEVSGPFEFVKSGEHWRFSIRKKEFEERFAGRTIRGLAIRGAQGTAGVDITGGAERFALLDQINFGETRVMEITRATVRFQKDGHDGEEDFPILRYVRRK